MAVAIQFSVKAGEEQLNLRVGRYRRRPFVGEKRFVVFRDGTGIENETASSG